MLDPANATAVEEHIAGLYPDADTRVGILNFFGEAIEEAHRYGPAKWKVAIRGKRIRLRMGTLTVYELKANRVRVGLSWQALSPEDRSFLKAEGRLVKEKRTHPPVAIWQLPAEVFIRNRDRLRPMFNDCLRIAAGAAKRVTQPETHSVATVECLERLLGRRLPQPTYIAQEDETARQEPEQAVAINQPRIVFKKVDYDVTGLLNYIEIGDIGLPEIQRPFVWSKAKVRDLFDSMYRGFPVGYLLFWASAESQGARGIGLGEKQHQVPALLIVDGQQRLTSLYAVLRGKPVVDEDFQETRIEIAFRPRDGRFEVTDAAIRRDPEFTPDISEIWASGKSSWGLVNEFLAKLEGKKKIEPAHRDIMGHNLDRLFDLQKYPFTALEISAQVDEEAVADIFVRINSEGVKLTQTDFILTLLSVFWENGRKALEAFSRSARIPPGHGAGASPFNYLIQPSPDQLLRVAVGIGFHRARMRSVYQVLRGKDVETNRYLPELRDKQFARLREAQEKALDLKHWHLFLGSLVGCGFRTREMISSENALLYSYTVYLLGKLQCGVEEHRLQRLIGRWFFAVTLSGRYTNSPETIMEGDLNRLKEVTSSEAFVEALERIIASVLTNDFWKITLPTELDTSASRSPVMFAYYAAQNKLGATVLFSDKRIGDMLDPGIRGKRKPIERHHLFPRRWLERNGVSDRRMINQSANFALLEWPDNAGVKHEPPSEYIPRMRKRFSPAAWERMCQLHALPDNWEELGYEEFLQRRRVLMAQVIKKGFEALAAEADDNREMGEGRPDELVVWRLIESTERTLRKLVRQKYTKKWAEKADSIMRQVLGEDAWATIQKMRERHQAQYPRSPEQEPGDILDFCYLGQLIQLMTSNQAWELFKEPFRDKRELEDIGRPITAVRNDVAHFRSVPARELERCRMAIDDLRVMVERI